MWVISTKYRLVSCARNHDFHVQFLCSLLRCVCRYFSVGCLWHSHGKNPVRLYPKLQSQPIGFPKIFIDYLFFQADQSDCTKSVSIFNRFASSEERWNQNVPCQICRPRGLGWLVNQRNPSGYWQVTKGDLSQIISSLHDSFLFRSSFFIRF